MLTWRCLVGRGTLCRVCWVCYGGGVGDSGVPCLQGLCVSKNHQMCRINDRELSGGGTSRRPPKVCTTGKPIRKIELEKETNPVSTGGGTWAQESPDPRRSEGVATETLVSKIVVGFWRALSEPTGPPRSQLATGWGPVKR